jgi:hypothetical protein
MKRCAILLVALVAFVSTACSGQTAARGEYMHLFFVGPNWYAGHGVVQYSPAFKGKTEELVAETEDTRLLSPNGFMSRPRTTTTSSSTESATVITTDRGTFVQEPNGSQHRQTAADLAKEAKQEAELIDKGLRLQEKRSNLARAALSKALNAVAADGWEVVQMTAYGTQGGLVYLLKKR